MSKPLDFSDALRALKKGERVTRAGWNGKGMFLVLARSPRVEVECPWTALPDTNESWTVGFGYAPHIAMRTANGSFVPWLASVTDLMAEDWEVVS